MNSRSGLHGGGRTRCTCKLFAWAAAAPKLLEDMLVNRLLQYDESGSLYLSQSTVKAQFAADVAPRGLCLGQSFFCKICGARSRSPCAAAAAARRRGLPAAAAAAAADLMTAHFDGSLQCINYLN